MTLVCVCDECACLSVDDGAALAQDVTPPSCVRERVNNRFANVFASVYHCVPLCASMCKKLLLALPSGTFVLTACTCASAPHLAHTYTQSGLHTTRSRAHLCLSQAQQADNIRAVHVPRLSGSGHVDARVGVLEVRVNANVLLLCVCVFVCACMRVCVRRGTCLVDVRE